MMNGKTIKTGTRVGDWFLWIECTVAKTDNYVKVPLVFLKDATSGGDTISTVVATREMANELRRAADGIDAVLDGLSLPKEESQND